MLNIKERIEITALKQKRQEKGITQEAFSKNLKLVLRTYQRYEVGERIPNVHTAIRIAENLGIAKYQDFKDLFLTPKEIGSHENS